LYPHVLFFVYFMVEHRGRSKTVISLRFWRIIWGVGQKMQQK
jgi:hypothetical protein